MIRGVARGGFQGSGTSLLGYENGYHFKTTFSFLKRNKRKAI